jgi:hypothetical protein
MHEWRQQEHRFQCDQSGCLYAGSYSGRLASYHTIEAELDQAWDPVQVGGKQSHACIRDTIFFQGHRTTIEPLNLLASPSDWRLGRLTRYCAISAAPSSPNCVSGSDDQMSRLQVIHTSKIESRYLAMIPQALENAPERSVVEKVAK